MKSKYLHAVGAVVAAVFSAGAVGIAQVQAPDLVPIQPSPNQAQPTQDERDPLVSPPRGQMSARQMLRALDQASPQRILLGEGVPEGARVSFRGQMRLSEILDALCRPSGLNWGYLNRDTIVVLRARPAPSLSVQSIPLPAPLPAPRGGMRNPLVPDPNFDPGPRPKSVPENATPRTFNGQQYYVIPLQPEAQAKPDSPTAPEPHEQR